MGPGRMSAWRATNNYFHPSTCKSISTPFQPGRALRLALADRMCQSGWPWSLRLSGLPAYFRPLGKRLSCERSDYPAGLEAAWERGSLEDEGLLKKGDKEQGALSLLSTPLTLPPWEWGHPARPTPWEAEASRPPEPDPHEPQNHEKINSCCFKPQGWGWFIRHQ